MGRDDRATDRVQAGGGGVRDLPSNRYERRPDDTDTSGYVRAASRRTGRSDGLTDGGRGFLEK